MGFKRHKKKVLVPRIDVLGVKVDDISQSKAIAAIAKLARDREKSHYVVTVNSEFVMLAKRNGRFREILVGADLALPDGMGVVLAKLIFGGKSKDRVTGVDLVEKLCAKCAKGAITVGFLGGFGKVAEEVAKRQLGANPGLRVVIAEPGDSAMGQNLRLERRFSKLTRVGILFVAYGMGRQEFWIKKNLKRLNVGVFIGVGGAFDVLSTVKRRVPRSLARWGLEWLWRLFWEPARIWRMRVLPIFAILVILAWTGKILKSFNFRSIL